MHRLCNYFCIFLHLFSFYFFLQLLRISLLSLIFRYSVQILLENASFCRQNARLKNYLFCSKFFRQNLSKPGAIIGDGDLKRGVHAAPIFRENCATPNVIKARGYSQHTRAFVTRDGAILSKNSTFVFFDGANATTENGI